jgi:hypothetical protein
VGIVAASADRPASQGEQHRTRARFRVILRCEQGALSMIEETREAIEAYCVAVGLVVYEWNDLHEKPARLFALIREGDRRETLAEWLRSGATRGSAKCSDAPLPRRHPADGKTRRERPTI